MASCTAGAEVIRLFYVSLQLAEVVELEHKLKELEATCSPIISKMYQGGARACPGSLPPCAEHPR